MKGFTLMEMLIVVVIIAILAGIAVPRITAMRQESLIAQAKAELRGIEAGLSSYYLHHSNSYPANAQFPAALETAVPNIIGSDAPQDPFAAGSEYGYDRGGTNNQYYVIYSVGPDGNGAASINNGKDSVQEKNGDSCIYISNAGKDTAP